MDEISKFIVRYDVDEWKDQYHKCRARSWLVSSGQVSVIFKHSCNDIIKEDWNTQY